MKTIIKAILATALVLSVITSYAFAAAETPKTFSDVPEDYWAANAIKKLAEEGIITGYGDGTFRPQQIISTTEAAALMARACYPATRAWDGAVALSMDMGLLQGEEAFASMNREIAVRMVMRAAGIWDSETSTCYYEWVWTVKPTLNSEIALISEQIMRESTANLSNLTYTRAQFINLMVAAGIV